MKPRAYSFAVQTISILFIAITLTLPSSSAPVKSAEVVQSVFVQPSNSKEGCDPFFPKSTRPYVVKSDGKSPELSSLIVRGGSFSGKRKFVIINNHTFGVGDFSTVITPQGQVYIHCVEINANNVVIESNGQRQILPFSSTP